MCSRDEFGRGRAVRGGFGMSGPPPRRTSAPGEEKTVFRTRSLAAPARIEGGTSEVSARIPPLPRAKARISQAFVVKWFEKRSRPTCPGSGPAGDNLSPVGFGRSPMREQRFALISCGFAAGGGWPRLVRYFLGPLSDGVPRAASCFQWLGIEYAFRRICTAKPVDLRNIDRPPSPCELDEDHSTSTRRRPKQTQTTKCRRIRLPRVLGV